MESVPSSDYLETTTSSSSFHAQVLTLDDVLLGNEVISLPALRKMASQGLDGDHDGDDAMIQKRGVVWRVLLGYIPLEHTEWEATLNQKRTIYINFCNDLFQDASDVSKGLELRKQQRWKQLMEIQDNNTESNSHEEEDYNYLTAAAAAPPIITTRSDQHQHYELPDPIRDLWKRQGRDVHILESLTRHSNALQYSSSSSSPHGGGSTDDSSWDDFVDSASLLDEIRKDVIRTHPDLAFYLDPIVGKRRYAVLERILFVWAKYNAGVKYVQGMNEIVAILYYVLAQDADEWAIHAEADTYWLFHILLAEMRDVFVPDLDDADTGIQGRIANMQTLLGKHDPEVKEHLEEIGIDASFYAIRWWTTLLSREFLLPDTIRLWDSMFASTHKDNFLRYVCVTMVMVIRDQLLKGDFSTCLRLLQSYPSTHMDHLLESSRALWVYETQITVACTRGGISLHQALQTIAPRPGIIMAYGFRHGSLSASRRLSGDNAAAKVRDATSAVANSASSLFGRAKGFYSKYSQGYARRSRSRSADGVEETLSSALSSTHSVSSLTNLEVGQHDDSKSAVDDEHKASDEVSPDGDPGDSIYLDAILKAA